MVYGIGGNFKMHLIPAENDHKFGAEDFAAAEEVILRNLLRKQAIVLLHRIDCATCTISVVHGTYF